MRLSAVLLVFVSSFAVSFAQESRPASRPSIPSPEAFLARRLGDVYTRHADIAAYAHLVAERSDRVSLESYGRTNEGRELLLLAVTSPENHRRMATIRAGLGKLADPRKMSTSEDARQVAADLPVVVWLSYNVHGNEASSSETSLVVLHRLATATDPETTRWLSQAVIVIDPCLNPDGRDRYVNWFNSVVGRRPDADPDAREHKEPWPGGRTNHYQFDLNRDWAFATQVETRSRLPHVVAWTPQVHVDFHEMSAESTYFFFPAEKPINANFPPNTLKWGKLFGQGNAAAFDKQGLPYYTSEDFDLFYPGYGDSWPSLTGAIGMTYEMAGHSTSGAAYVRRDGQILTLDDRLRRHELATYGTIETAVSRRQELLLDYHAFRRSAIEEGQGGAVRAFVLSTAEDPTRADELVRNLRLQGIEVARTKAGFTVARTRDIHGQAVVDRTFDAGTYVVPMNQPLKRLAKTLLEPRTEIHELYFYDVSAWSLPLIYGVPCYELDQPPEVELEGVDAVARRPGSVDQAEATVGWLMDGTASASMFGLADLLRAGVRVRAARKPFTHGGIKYARGGFLVRRSDNGPDVASTIAGVADRTGARFKAVNSGLSTVGVDLGSESFGLVSPPRILLGAGRGIDSTSFGAARYVLDVAYDLPHGVVDLDDLERIDLRRATALVLPDGRAPRSKAALEAMRQFLRDGGVVVAIGAAAFELASGEKEAFSSVRSGEPKRDDSKPETTTRKVRFIDEEEAEARKRQAPGSIFTVELDPGHPLAFGYRSDVTAFKSGLTTFDPEGPGRHVGLFKDAAPISGYVNDADAKALQGRSYVTVDSVGEGSLVLFADDPNFRGAWHALSRLFLNACLLLPNRPVR